MPELPEVETVARQLKPKLVGRKIVSLNVLDSKLKHLAKTNLDGYKVVEVERLGKQVVLSLQKNKSQKYVAVHLRMTGRLIWSDRKVLADPHRRLDLKLNGGFLNFVDTRRFGTVEVADNLSNFTPKGQEPLSSEFNLDYLIHLTKNSKQNIKHWLLRQDKIVGLGNIYASEILFASGISPIKEVGKLKKQELTEICKHTKRILKKAIANCGTTFSDFQDSRGDIGNFQKFLKVYDREGLKCINCPNKIERIVQQGRSTFYCKRCQR